MTPSVSRRFVWRWLLAGMLGTIGVAVGMSFVYYLSSGASIKTALIAAPWMSALVAFCAVVLMPLSFGMLWAYSKLLARFPEIESSALSKAAGLFSASVLLAGLVGVASQWRLLRFASSRSEYFGEAYEVMIAVLAWCLVGIIAPRFVVPSLRRSNTASDFAA